jgi:hypothetical protein
MWNLKNLKERMLRPESESGQAIVLVALFMVILLAMLGVAIDGGGLFLLWRDAQNAADTAVLQAAYSRCTSPFGSNSWINVGKTAASVNGFTQTDPNSTVTVQPWADDSNFIEVIIDANKPAYFIQLVYRGPLAVQARSLAFCQRAFDPASVGGGVGLMGCDVCDTQDTQFDATGSDMTFNGPITSNCDVRMNPSGAIGGTVNGDVNATGTTNNVNDKVDVNGDIVNGAPEIDQDYLNTPLALYAPGGEIYTLAAIKYAVDTNGDGFYPINDTTPDTGTWDTSDIPGGVVQGLIYVDGNIQNDTGNWGAKGATLVATGKVDFANNNSDVYKFYGWNSQITGDQGITVAVSTGDVYPSFLAYANFDQLNPVPDCANMTSQGSAAITTRGNGTVLYGVLYAPHGGISWSGSTIVGEGALIGQKVNFAGSSTTYTFNPAMLPPRAPRINIVE